MSLARARPLGIHPDAGTGEEPRLAQLGPWQRTPAASRAVLLGGVGAVLALLTRRVDLLVLAMPFLAVATWGWAARPRHTGSAVARVGTRTLAEGQATAWTVTLRLPEAAEETIVRLSPGGFVAVDPSSDRTAIPAPPGGQPVERRIAARVTRWGIRRVGPGFVTSRSAWWAYRTPIQRLGAFQVRATPMAVRFDAAAMTPHPEGLVGLNRSVRAGVGTEFATIREFQPGDRLRRIHWPATLRYGTVQVRTTYADADAHVVLVVDAFSDLGPREGVDGRATSLDLTVRACAALAEHYVRAGDRVSLRVLGSEGITRVPVGSGRAQIVRLLDTLARIRPATDRSPGRVRSLAGLVSGSLVVVLSPLVHPAMTGLVSAVAARGLTTVVIDTLPSHLSADPADPYAAVAWRLRRLDRDDEVHRLRAAGVPVVAWVGPGSLDLVLRGLARRGAHPRLVAR